MPKHTTRQTRKDRRTVRTSTPKSRAKAIAPKKPSLAKRAVNAIAKASPQAQGINAANRSVRKATRKKKK